MIFTAVLAKPLNVKKMYTAGIEKDVEIKSMPCQFMRFHTVHGDPNKYSGISYEQSMLFLIK